MIDWHMTGQEFGNCNCDYGCPCQFNALPTDGTCRGLMAARIDEGHFGAVRLDGLCWVCTFRWPGPIHQGDGSFQPIIDERADAAQRRALHTILTGGETAPGANMLAIYSAMVSTTHEPLFLPIEFECDQDRRCARLVVGDLIETTVEPIRNPVTGAEHRVRIELPEGLEFTLAEMGSGSTSARGTVPLDLADSYSQLSRFDWTGTGVVR